MLISRRLFQNESEAAKAQPLHGSSRVCVRTLDTASRNGPTGETCATFDPQECAVRLPGPSERTQTSTQACGRPAAAPRPVPDQKEPRAARPEGEVRGQIWTIAPSLGAREAFRQLAVRRDIRRGQIVPAGNSLSLRGRRQ